MTDAVVLEFPAPKPPLDPELQELSSLYEIAADLFTKSMETDLLLFRLQHKVLLLALERKKELEEPR